MNAEKVAYRLNLAKQKKGIYLRGKKVNPTAPHRGKRCKIDGKIIFDRGRAEKRAEAVQKLHGDPRLVAYFGKCKKWHVGHNYKIKN